jgi:hypothetical protein
VFIKRVVEEYINHYFQIIYLLSKRFNKLRLILPVSSVNGGGINGTSSSIAAGGPSVGQQNNFPSPIGGTPSAAAGGTSAASGGGGGRRPKLSEKMKSLSLDCADMPPPVQNSMRSGAFSMLMLSLMTFEFPLKN